MTAPYRGHAGPPPRALTGPVRQLDDNLQRLAVRSKDAIAAAIGGAVAEAVKDGVNGLLGGDDGADPARLRPHPAEAGVRPRAGEPSGRW